jgi:hypothetical protein
MTLFFFDFAKLYKDLYVIYNKKEREP